MKLSILTRYGPLGPSSRCRYYDYMEHFTAAGIEAKIHPMLGNSYVKGLYSGKSRLNLKTPTAYIKRLIQASLASERLLLEYELFPYLPYFVDKLFLNKHRYVLNFDDNVWDKYVGKGLLKNKFDRLCQNADGIIVANDFLMEKVAPLNDRIIKIPTAVNLNKYQQQYDKFEDFTFVWIGTPVTYQFMLRHAESIRMMLEATGGELLIIARKELEQKAISGLKMHFVDWSEKIEAELLCRSHVGIMPLTDDSFAQGKSAFKIIQYFAAGIPVIASPIGANTKVVEDGINGLLATSPEDWEGAGVSMKINSPLYAKLASGAKASSHQYSIQHWAKPYCDFLKNVLA
jgi:glycosyltransferase involved in cell wall biosynthesis